MISEAKFGNDSFCTKLAVSQKPEMELFRSFDHRLKEEKHDNVRKLTVTP